MAKKTISILIFINFACIVNISAQIYLKSHIGVRPLPANNDPVCTIPWYLGSFYTSGIQAGDTCADFTLYDLNGDSLNLKTALADGKPVLLVNGSYTCPVFRGKVPVINNVIATYGSQVKVYIIYTVEAHPAIDTSVYFGYVNTGSQNISAGILYRQPTTYGERKAVVDSMLSKMSINAPVYIDGPCNNWWSYYGPAPNNAYLIRPNGVVFTKHGWFDKYPDRIFCDIDSLLGITGNCNNNGGTNGTFTLKINSNDTVWDQPGNTLTIDGELLNNTNQSCLVKVKRLINDTAAGWATSLCLDVCYSTSTDSVTILIPPNSKQDFHFYFYSSSFPDTSRARVGFLNMNNSNNKYSRNFVGITSLTTAIASTESNSFVVYPNPVSNKLILKSNSAFNAEYVIVDVTGAVKKRGMLENTNEINTSELVNGFYLLYVIYPDQHTACIKFIKK